MRFAKISALFYLIVPGCQILDKYLERRPIEVFFRQSKGRLAFDKYQIRSSKGIQRYWLLMSLAHFIACTGYGKAFSFEEGYAYFYRSLQEERITYVYQCGKKQVPLANVLALAA